ncbi:MAG: TonB-dependent receptor plug domain-containing protein, partial [Bacteroidales bacterium]
MRRFITFVLGTILTLTCLAQERTITGRITDFNNRPLVEVKVWYKSDSDFAFSDPDGIYKISVPDGYDSLFYSKTGYFQDKIAVDDNNEINIRLEIEQIYDLSFEDLLNTKVSTVSLGEQNIADAPGVVRVITHDELNRLGIRTIKEALTLVPGFSLMQNDDEQIFSVRGIFATTNQKILVMRDGHSLNEANLDIPQIEYSLSVNNIEKIEIIRGPGASIYGNSAMASVINIITRNKANTEAKVSVGNYGQSDFDFYTGKKISEKSNILIFGRYANVKGQEFPVSYQVNGQPFKGKYITGH